MYYSVLYTMKSLFSERKKNIHLSTWNFCFLVLISLFYVKDQRDDVMADIPFVSSHCRLKVQVTDVQ